MLNKKQKEQDRIRTVEDVRVGKVLAIVVTMQTDLEFKLLKMI